MTSGSGQVTGLIHIEEDSCTMETLVTIFEGIPVMMEGARRRDEIDTLSLM